MDRIARIPRRRWIATVAALLALGAGTAVVVTGRGESADSQELVSVVHYQVAGGDTWASIAAAYGLTPLTLARQNGNTSTSSQPISGRVLHIVPGTPPPTTTTSPPSTSTSTTLPPTTTTTTVAPTTTTTSTTSTTTTSTVAPTTTTTPPTTTTVPGSGFLATFDTPGDFYDRFDTYTGNYCNFGTDCRPETAGFGIDFPGSHNLACQPPPTTRTIDMTDPNPIGHGNLFWWCAPGGAPTGHVMTGLNTSGYALVSFTPKQSFTNVSQVCWDASLADLGGGKWFNVVLVPEAHYLQFPNTNPRRVEDGEGPYRLDYVTPDFIASPGPGMFNIQDLGSGANAIVGVKQFRGTTQIYRGTAQLYDDQVAGAVWTAGADESTRFRHCFRDNGNGTVTYEQGRTQGTLKVVTVGGSFPDGPVRVLFQDDTYDADKHGGTGRYTWHWDNISIAT